MYSDDNIICCLLPSSCNMFDRTPGVIFMDTMWYLNIMIIVSSFIFVFVSISRIVHQLVEKFKDKLIVHKDSSEENRIKEQPSLQTEVLTDKYSNEDFLPSSSDSDLVQRLGNKIDESNSDCYNSRTGSSEDAEIRDIDLDKNNKSTGNRIDSTDQCFNKSSSEEIEHCNHTLGHDYFADTGQSLVSVKKEPFVKTIKEETNNDHNSNDK